MSPRSLVMPLPHRFTIALAPSTRPQTYYWCLRSRAVRGGAVYSLLHYSVGSPRLAVSQPAVLRCSDFPPVALLTAPPAIAQSALQLPTSSITTRRGLEKSRKV